MKTSAPLDRRLIALLVLCILATTGVAQSGTNPSAASPTEPIAAILDAFRSHSLVALGESHGRLADQIFDFADS